MLNYFRKRRQRGQSTLEYVILIIIILGALLSIQVYIKRGIQGRLKSATDDIGDQFKPGGTNVVRWVNTYSKTQDSFGFNDSGDKAIGVSRSELLNVEYTNEYMNASIVDVNQDFWGQK